MCVGESVDIATQSLNELVRTIHSHQLSVSNGTRSTSAGSGDAQSMQAVARAARSLSDVTAELSVRVTALASVLPSSACGMSLDASSTVRNATDVVSGPGFFDSVDAHGALMRLAWVRTPMALLVMCGVFVVD